MIVDLTKTELHYLKFLAENKVKHEPEYVNQQEAFRRFKRCNVERWVRNAVVKRYMRPKNIEYNLDELKRAAANRQDYLIE